LQKTEAYDQFTEKSAEHLDEFVKYFPEHVRELAGDPSDQQKVFIETKIEGDRLRIRVIPNKRQNDMGRLI